MKTKRKTTAHSQHFQERNHLKARHDETVEMCIDFGPEHNEKGMAALTAFWQRARKEGACEEKRAR